MQLDLNVLKIEKLADVVFVLMVAGNNSLYFYLFASLWKAKFQTDGVGH